LDTVGFLAACLEAKSPETPYHLPDSSHWAMDQELAIFRRYESPESNANHFISMSYGFKSGLQKRTSKDMNNMNNRPNSGLITQFAGISRIPRRKVEFVDPREFGQVEWNRPFGSHAGRISRGLRDLLL
jgi:hypothetical protein